MWLGLGLLAHPSGLVIDEGREPGARFHWAARGFGVSGLNPKVFLLFLALLPQFALPTASWPVPGQMLALGVVHVLNCAAVYLMVATGARVVLRSRPGAALKVSRVSGIAMVVIATFVIAEPLLQGVTEMAGRHRLGSP